MIHLGATLQHVLDGSVPEREEIDPAGRSEDDISLDIFDNIYRGRLALVKRDINKFNVNTHFGPHTWLQLAARFDRLDIMKYFVEECHAYVGMRGYVDGDMTMTSDKTALHTAADYQRAGIVEYLLQLEDGEFLRTAKDSEGKIPQDYARTRATLRAFGVEVGGEEDEGEGEYDEEEEGEYEEEFYGEWSEGLSEGVIDPADLGDSGADLDDYEDEGEEKPAEVEEEAAEAQEQKETDDSEPSD